MSVGFLTALLGPTELTGDISHDVTAFLLQHGRPKTASHSAAVAGEAARLADVFGESPHRASQAGWLHDVSAVFPAGERAAVARSLGIDLLPEEDAFPLIAHQKLSRLLARELFGVTDLATLEAIGCHTTLRANASRLDKVVFLADKIAWDRPGVPPYLDALMAQLQRSLDEGVLVYLRYLWEQQGTLPVVHPWFREAYKQLAGALPGAEGRRGSGGADEPG